MNRVALLLIIVCGNAFGEARPILKHSAIRCIEIRQANLIEILDAKSDLEMKDAYMKAVYAGACLFANQDSWFVADVVRKTTPNGNAYSCFRTEVEIGFPRKSVECTAAINLSTIEAEVNVRSGVFEIGSVTKGEVEAKCLEGGEVKIFLTDGGVPARRISNVLPFRRKRLGIEDYPVLTGDLDGEIRAGCKGVDAVE